MKTLEYNHGNNWFDKFNNWLAVDASSVKTAYARASDNEGVYAPDNKSLFYNGLWFIRVTYPFGIWLGMRPTATGPKYHLGAGYKLNGRFGLICRRQTDESAAHGTHGPNHGQATGWSRGTA